MSQPILFSDIDGTLLNAERELSHATLTEIKRIKEKIPFILISSRMPSAMRHLQQQLAITHLPLICYNGGLVIVDNKTVHSTSIPINIVKSLAIYNQTINTHISLYHNDEWHVPQMDYWANREANNTKVQPTVTPIHQTIERWETQQKGAHKIMCMGEEQEIDAIVSYLETHFDSQLHLYRSKPTYLEIANKEVSKFTAIELLLKNHYNIDISNAIAFGDNYNDIEMLSKVGTGVAVANAKPEVLKIADYITLSSKEDGVANYIKTHIK
ncbi:Cof-type HAD-IIB family hydrolase [Aquimarina rhabdastrellae]